MQVFLNGSYVPAADARVSVDDRGFLFADGVYEVIRAYPGGLFLAEAHILRMREGLEALRIDPASADDVLEIGAELLERNELRGRDSTIYAQVTRGAAPRKHAFPPAGTPTTLYVATRAFPGCPAEWYADGVAAITVPDTRWSRCDIKSVALLPNVLANQAAHDADAFEALLVRDGVVIEGSHANLFAVRDDTLLTYPASNYILNGITRRFVLQLAAELNIPVRECGLHVEQLYDVDELFLSGTTTEILPVTRVDGRLIADGRAGPLSMRLLAEFRARLPQGDAAKVALRS